MTKERFDIHQHITDKIVSAIERGAGDFRLPWHRAAGNIMRPVNIASKKAYRGVNVVALWAYAEEFGYSSGTWGTYKQWSEAGAQVRKGEKAAFVVFYKELEFAADPETGDAETATRLFARATPVFAAEQVDGYQAPVIDASPATVITPIEQAEAFVAATGATIHHGGTRAFYRPSTDSIQLPPREAFIGTADQHAGGILLFHTLSRADATGLEPREPLQSATRQALRRPGLCDGGAGRRTRSRLPLRRSPHHRRAANGSRAISRVLACRLEGRQEGDLHRRIQGVRSRRVPRRSATPPTRNAGMR